ncbi:MAG: hypothetical protein CM1200mP41_09870 [Gammaproteobacteria bacterium]|nr:MAG: hypothetical protein CM1200mP41_09870 [Gammaproteobacteria bacterium]
MTTTYRNHNFFESERPAIGWLRECINQAVIRYLKQTAVDYPLEWHLQGWPNINRFGDYHNLQTTHTPGYRDLFMLLYLARSNRYQGQ